LQLARHELDGAAGLDFRFLHASGFADLMNADTTKRTEVRKRSRSVVRKRVCRLDSLQQTLPSSDRAGRTDLIRHSRADILAAIAAWVYSGFPEWGAWTTHTRAVCIARAPCCDRFGHLALDGHPCTGACP
jgi:hypothetical protein